MSLFKPSYSLKQHSISALLLGICAGLCATVALAQPWTTRLDVGGLLDSPFLQRFYAPEANAQTSYRWSRPEAEVLLPGAGQLVPLELSLHSETPGMVVQIDAGQGLFPVTLGAGWQHVQLLSRAAPVSGDVRVLLRAPTQVSATDTRERGVALEQVALRGAGGTAPPAQAALLGLSVALLSLALGWNRRRIGVGVAAGALATVGLGVALLLGGGAWRMLLTVYSGRLALVLALSTLLLFALEQLLAWLTARGIIGAEAASRRGLAGVAALAFFLRYAATSYPLIYMLDIKYHLARARIMGEGRFLELFLPNQYLAPQQWRAHVTIPYSPFFYMLTFPVTYLAPPWDRLALLAFGALVDAAAVLLVALLVLRAGLGSRAAAIAALLAATIPYGLWWAVSWGLFPNLLGQCLILLAAFVWLLMARTPRRGAWGWLAAAMTMAYLSYATSMMFLGVAWLLLLLLLAVRRDPALGPTFKAGALAALLAFALYYGWHAPALVRESLPAVMSALGGSGRFSGARAADPPPGLAQLTDILLFRYDPLLLLTALVGALLLSLRWGRRAIHRAQHRPTGASIDASRLALLMLAWVLVYPIFAFFDYYVPLVEKHALHLLPALAILAGLLLARLARYRWGRIVTLALLALVIWQGLLLGLDVIVFQYVAEK